MECLLAIDSGLTVTKAVIFGLDGSQIGVARRNVAQSMPRSHHVERDMNDLWAQTASAIREVIEATDTSPGDILAVAATAHGDGIYLLDHQGAPLGPGVLSLDSRAAQEIADWDASGVSTESLDLTGQAPHISAPSALLAWFKSNEPERFAKIGHAFACKDWLRLCLCGSIGTDRTEASTSFTDYRTQDYTPDALDLFGLSELKHALPDVSFSADIVGSVTAEAARETGLREGTPVAAGLHDVTASALGIGAHTQGIAAVISGTYSINQCVSSVPLKDPRWQCRNAILPGLWNNMSNSPASTANYEWFLETFCRVERALAEEQGKTIHDVLAPEIEGGLDRASTVLFHPYLFGSPYGAAASAGFYGVRGWHNRGDLLAALLEGVVLNHRIHVDALKEGFAPTHARITGGASRNPTVARLFADALGMPLTVTNTDEAAAWGAALCAGAAVGAFSSFEADPRDLDAISTTYVPDPARADHYSKRFKAFTEIANDMAGNWDRLNALESLGGRGAG